MEMVGCEESVNPIRPTDEQLEVIESPAEARLWVEAGAGSGKTEAVARRLAWLLASGGLRPRQILVLSFSRSAVRALVERLRRLTDVQPVLLEDLRHVTVRTFDSWSFRILRLLGEDASELLQHGHDHNIKRALEKLKYCGADDPLAADTVGLSQVQHIVTDEVQDLTGLRGDFVLALLKRFAPPGMKGVGFTLLGDSNQAIYGFSADPDISDMTAPKFRETVRKLWAKDLVEKSFRENHRANGAAATHAAAARKALASAKPGEALDNMRKLLDKVPADNAGSLVEALSEQRDGVAILCRDNHQIAGVISQLQYSASENELVLPPLTLRAGRPPTIVPAWVGVVLHQVRSVQLTKSQYERIWTLLKRPGSPSASWELLVRASGKPANATSIDLGELRSRLYWPDSFPDDETLSGDAVTITTIHQSKGLEFEHVYLVDRGDSITPKNVDEDEEARVLFVGLTRARRQARRGELNGMRPFGSSPSREDPECRWHRTLRKDWRQLEAGCEGDVDFETLVTTDWMGDKEAVRKLQNLLLENGPELVGRKVTLVKADVPGDSGKKIYRIDLDEALGSITTLGFLKQRFTHQLLEFIDWRKYTLPGKIFDLRVQAVTTVARVDDFGDAVPEPWRQSRFWLAPVIHGIGRFKLYAKGGDGRWPR